VVKTPEKLLCIGGHLDGQFRTILYGRAFTEVIPEPVQIACYPSDYIAMESGVMARGRYHLEEMVAGENEIISFWVPDGQTFRETIEMLLQTYHQARGSQ
jgi:hypothetical protein